MKVLHISAECYPAAKAGGLGDVAGALPKYLSQADYPASVTIPKYQTKWIVNQQWQPEFEGRFQVGNENIYFRVEQLVDSTLGFRLYVVDIPGKYDRPSVYLDEHGKGFWDEVERSLCFQQAVLHWVKQFTYLPEIIHCHDHHTALVPFMMKHCVVYRRLAHVPTIFTIHNAEYSGAFHWHKVNLLPLFDGNVGGLLDWDGVINPLASAIKCCWRLTTVSPTYMTELQQNAGTLVPLLQHEYRKSAGILNGIDVQVWNPKTDELLTENLKRSWKNFKKNNKNALKERFTIQDDLPLITFIGRLAGEKGAQLLAPMIDRFFALGQKASFIILGTGDPHIHYQLGKLAEKYEPYVNVALEYNEQLAHQLYAGSDFLVMPSKVEPCGLNQMYAMRYGTVPIVRAVGGLKDTVQDIGHEQGRGVQFQYLSIEDAAHALQRAVYFYEDKKAFEATRKRITEIDFSWENSAKQYIDLYEEVTTTDYA